MADLAEIAQSGIDPVSGSPLSAEKRKELFRRSQISSAGIFGGGGSGALVPSNSGPDPQTLELVKSNSDSISSFQNQLNNLTEQNNQVLSNLGKLNYFQEQLNVIQTSVIDLGNNLQQISSLISDDTVLEQQKEKISQEQEKKVAEAGIRQGKEKELETKIREALVAPINKIGIKVKSAFERLVDFIGELLGAWLTIQVLDFLKASKEGNTKKIDDIKKNVLSSLTIVGGILTVLSVGIFGVIGTIIKLTTRLGKFILSNTIGRLFGSLFDLGKKTLGLGSKPTASARTATAGTGAMNAGVEATKDVSKGTAGEKPKGMGGFGALTNLAFGGLEFFNRKSEGQTNLQAGAGSASSVAGAEYGARLGSKLPGWLKIPGMIGGGLAGWATGGGLSDMLTGVSEENPESTETSPSTQTSSPTSSKSSSPETFSSISSPSQAQTSSTPSSPQISPAQVQKVPSAPTNIPREPEVKPNIVYASSGRSNSQNSLPKSTMNSGSATDVPLFPSSNPDNFYSLYSQVSYNVIM